MNNESSEYKLKHINIIGHSHINAILTALNEFKFTDNYNLVKLHEHEKKMQLLVNVDKNKQKINQDFLDLLPHEKNHQSFYFLMIGGNAHNILGLLQHPKPFDFVLSNNPELPLLKNAEIIPYEYMKSIMRSKVLRNLQLLSAFKYCLKSNIYQIESPPPIGDDEHIKKYIEPFFRDKYTNHSISPRFLRYKLWVLHSNIVREACDANKINYLSAPSSTMDGDGFLNAKFFPDNTTHANSLYGKEILQQIKHAVELSIPDLSLKNENFSGKRRLQFNPYRTYPPTSFWKKAVSEASPYEIDPAMSFKFIVSPDDLVATAGSCFAQHISRNLNKNGFNYFVAEKQHPIDEHDSAKLFNYGTFSARYGNIYTSRQLLQLIYRAYNEFVPKEDIWFSDINKFVDPFRPLIQPDGFSTEEELREDRKKHLSAVRYMFETLDYFVFTLGLTECWMSTADGAVFPVCPGVSGGVFDSHNHKFENLNVFDVVNDMSLFVEKLRNVNTKAKIILTVSPVPLMATAANRHVLVSSTYSKSVLRVACEMLINKFENIAYFPAFEIITGAFSRGKYFESDLRSVTEEGVAHVMKLFMKHAAKLNSITDHKTVNSRKTDSDQNFIDDMKNIVEVICDEEVLNSCALFR
jgi:hypothetical protein